MADVRGMYELGASANRLADTFGNLPAYDLKQAAYATETAGAKNALTKQQNLASDLQAEQQWQQEAANRDDFGTSDYADAKIKFLQNAGASSTAITKAQIEAQQASHTGQMQDLAQNYVQKSVEDRIAQTLGREYYKDNLADLEKTLVDAKTPPDKVHQKMIDAAIQAGRNYMADQGITVNIDHKTGAIQAIDAKGNSVPIDPDIAAQAYNILGHQAPWKAMAQQQAEAIASAKMFGGGAGPAPAGTVTPEMKLSAAMANRMIASMETDMRGVRTRYENAALKALSNDNLEPAERKKLHDELIEERDKQLAPLETRWQQLHQTSTGSMSAAPGAAAPAATPRPDPVALAAAASGQLQAAPAVQPTTQAAPANPQDMAQIAQQAAQFLKALHLDTENLNSPQVQAYIATLPPQLQAVLKDLLDHAMLSQQQGLTTQTFTQPGAGAYREMSGYTPVMQ